MTKTIRNLARLGVEMGEGDGELFTTTLRALASPQVLFGNDAHIQMVTAQVYDEAVDSATPQQAAEYVETFLTVFDVESLADVDGLLGRESHLQDNYEGQLAFAKADK